MTVSLFTIHGRLANMALYYAIIMTVWGGWRMWRKAGVDGAYLGAAWIFEILLVIQAALGIFLWVRGPVPFVGWWIHVLIGGVSLLIIPCVYSYTHYWALWRRSDRQRSLLFYTVAFLFLIGVTLRDIMVLRQ